MIFNVVYTSEARQDLRDMRSEVSVPMKPEWNYGKKENFLESRNWSVKIMQCRYFTGM